MKNLDELMTMALTLAADSKEHDNWLECIPETDEDIVIHGRRSPANQACDLEAEWELEKLKIKDLNLESTETPEVLFRKLQRLTLSPLEERFVDVFHETDLAGYQRIIYMNLMQSRWSDLKNQEYRKKQDNMPKNINRDKETKQKTADDLLREMEKLFG